MEEKKAEQHAQAEGITGEGNLEQLLDELKNVSGGVSDKINALFAKWGSEGVEPSGMFERVSYIFDCDPRRAAEAFGGDYLDIVDYFTHYWN